MAAHYIGLLHECALALIRKCIYNKTVTIDHSSCIRSNLFSSLNFNWFAKNKPINLEQKQEHIEHVHLYAQNII